MCVWVCPNHKRGVYLFHLSFVIYLDDGVLIVCLPFDAYYSFNNGFQIDFLVVFNCVPYIFMKLNFIDFLNRMQTRKKFKEFAKGNFDVINELTSFKTEDVALVRI